MHGVIRHTAVDVVLDGAGAFGGVGQSAADGYLVAGLGGGVDEGELSSLEEGVHERIIVKQWALEEGDIWEALEFLGDEAFERVDLGAYKVADGRSDANEGGGLAAGGIDDGDSFHLWVSGGYLEGIWYLEEGWSNRGVERGEKPEDRGSMQRRVRGEKTTEKDDGEGEV